jgi:site-specific recombinase XerD
MKPKKAPTQDEAANGEVVAGELVEVTTLATIEPASLVLPVQLPADQNPAAVYLASLGQSSQRVVLSDLQAIAGIVSGGTTDAYSLNWATLRFQHTAAIRATLAERYTYTGANRMISSLRGVLKAAWRLGQITTDDYHRTIDIANIKGESLPAGRALKAGELRTLFHYLKTKAGTKPEAAPGAARDAALLAVLYGAGLRRSEPVALMLADFDRETGAIAVLHGKGNKARIAYATNGSRDAIAAWLEYRGEAAGPLFCPVLKSGRIEPRRMTPQAVYYILAERAKEAGLTDVSPHDFRRTFISDLLDAGADIATVQKLAGHANVDTTAKYDRRGEVKKQKAAELLFVPFEK